MSFLIFGDMGTSDNFQKSVAKSMIKLINENNIKFIIGLGDNIYEHGVKSVNDKKFKTHFEIPYKNINLKFFLCIGNHDYGEIFNHIIPDNYKYQIEYTKFSNKWYLPKRYYTFSKKMNGTQVDFFVLDTNVDLMNNDEIMKQLLYFKKEINKSKGNWKVICGHHTYRSIAGHGNAEPLLDNFFNDLFSLNKIDIYMCGHDHTKQYIQKRQKKKILHLIVCGTGGKPYGDLTNLNNMKDCDLYFSSTNLGVGLINCKKNKCDISFFNEQNQLEYNYSIKK